MEWKFQLQLSCLFSALGLGWLYVDSCRMVDVEQNDTEAAPPRRPSARVADAAAAAGEGRRGRPVLHGPAGGPNRGPLTCFVRVTCPGAHVQRLGNGTLVSYESTIREAEEASQACASPTVTDDDQRASR